MEDIKIDISNPENFVWDGSIIHGFDHEELAQIYQIRKKIRSSISRKNRKDYSKFDLMSMKSRLENLTNGYLLKLDTHIAALKHDSRALLINNIGIAASIDNATSKKTTSQAKFQIAVEKVSKENEEEEKKKSQEFQKSIEQLKEEASLKSNEVKKFEKEASNLKAKAEKHTARLNNYNKYNEWVNLNKNLNSLKQKRENLENSMRKIKSNNNHFFNPRNDYSYNPNNMHSIQNFPGDPKSFPFRNDNTFLKNSYNLD